MDKLSWYFPPTGGGEEHGFKNPELAHFEKDDPIISLAREVLQNSLDAKKDNSKPVVVDFEVEDLATKTFPDLNGFSDILKSCQSISKDDVDAQKFYENAFKSLDSQHLKILKISDFNTTGLSPSNWGNLVKSSGTSQKDSSSAGGSFGFGKAAPFASSSLRTLFYSSLDQDNNYLVQGKSWLQTHINKSGDKTQRIGLFGSNDGDMDPINDSELIKNKYRFYQREEIGVSIYIIGFSDSEDWYEKVAYAVLKNFFPALHQEKLVVNIRPKGKENIHLGSHGLESEIKKFTSTDNYKYEYIPQQFEAYMASQANENTNHCHIYETDIAGKGAIRVTTYKKKGFPKRNIYFRSTGMIIQAEFHRSIEAISIIEILGKDLNSFLRSIENPTHDKWEPNRFKEDPATANYILRAIRAAIKECRDQLINTNSESIIDFSGMEQYLPDDPNLINEKENEEKLIEDINKPKAITLKKESSKKVGNKKPTKVKTGNEDGGGSIGEKPGGGNKGKKYGPDGPDGPGGGDDGPKEGNEFKEYSLNKIRVIGQNRGAYKILFSSLDDKSIYLEVSIRDEGGANYGVNLESAFYKSTELEVKDDKYIGPIDMKAESENEIIIHLKDKENYVLGVKPYEYK